MPTEATTLNIYGNFLSVCLALTSNVRLDQLSLLLLILLAYRFFLGFGIGAEYPAGTVAAAENTEDPGISKNMQQKLLVLATNTM